MSLLFASFALLAAAGSSCSPGLAGQALTSDDSPEASIPAPPVTVAGTLKRPKGSPAPMASGAHPRSAGEASAPYPARLLPTPTVAEIRAADADVRKVLEAMRGVGSVITLDELRKVLPGIESGRPWVSRGVWRIQRNAHGSSWKRVQGRTSVVLGAVFIRATIEEIRQLERNYSLYLKRFKSDYETVYPVAGSYWTGTWKGRPWTSIDVYSNSESWWYEWSLRFRIVESTERGCPTVRYTETSGGAHWGAGVDRYIEVRRNGRRLGVLLYTNFGLDLDGVPDSLGDLRDTMRKNLKYTSGR